MWEKFENFTSRQLAEITHILNECTDEYIYVFNITKDTYFTSEQVLKNFNFPSQYFDNAQDTLLRMTYPADRAQLAEELDKIKKYELETHNLEYRWTNKNGKQVWISCRGKVLPHSRGEDIVMVGRVSLLDERDKIDLLTSLPTEGMLRKDFTYVWKRNLKISGFMLKIDVDNLGFINEQYGIKTGDMVLSLVADCARKACAGLAKPYKLNSDEIICVNLSGMTAVDAKKIYTNLKRSIAEVEQQIQYEVVFTVSAGAVAFFNDPSTLDELLKKINFTMTIAKSRGRNNLSMFDAVAYAKHLRSMEIQELMREAVRNKFEGFELFYQPVVDAKNLYLDKYNSIVNVIGAEALIRWSCPRVGYIGPDEFIPILEDTGLIIPVGRWILLTAFRQCKEWNRVKKDFHMSVNLSYIQVRKSDILTDVRLALERSKVDPQNITLEITESGYMDCSIDLQELLGEFSRMGFKIDIDDFGTGYSNLRYLQYLHANTLKLDYSFVHKATGGNEGDKKVIKHITEMAHELGMAVCMEGVETQEDIGKLLEYKPDKFQGFYFGRPASAAQFRERFLLVDSKIELLRTNVNPKIG